MFCSRSWFVPNVLQYQLYSSLQFSRSHRHLRKVLASSWYWNRLFHRDHRQVRPSLARKRKSFSGQIYQAGFPHAAIFCFWLVEKLDMWIRYGRLVQHLIEIQVRDEHVHFEVTWVRLSLFHFSFQYRMNTCIGAASLSEFAVHAVMICLWCNRIFASCTLHLLVYLLGSHGQFHWELHSNHFCYQPWIDACVT